MQVPPDELGRTGSPYVELDSWIYPAIERLAALGYIRMAFLGMRPWTRIECAHLVEEASDRVAFAGEAGSGEAARLYYALEKEFAGDLETGGGSGVGEVNSAAGVGLFHHDRHQWPASERQLSFRADDYQQLRPAVSGGYQLV